MLAKCPWLRPAQVQKRDQDSFGLVQTLDWRLCYTKKVLLDSSVERPDRIETCNQEEPLLEHSDTRLLAGSKLPPLATSYDEARKLWAASKPTIDRAQFGGPGVDGAICRPLVAD